MLEDDRLEEIYRYTRKTHRWVVFIGAVTIMSIVLSVCSLALTF
ncbi:MAG: hypothetical protein OXC98_09475 [bacterium]|nr:hypothetical protein [bacterium]